MADPRLIERLAALPTLSKIPRDELEWIAEHGVLELHETGVVIAPKGERIEKLWIVLSGALGVRVDRGAGPRRVMGWSTGEVAGMLPYSRMKGPPGPNSVEDTAELVTIHEKHYPEMIHACPTFTAYTVHLMLDRARNFNTSDLQDEKMISLGKLAAGLAHELNNPASATVRGAKSLQESLAAAAEASRALGAAGLTREQLQAIDEMRNTCLSSPGGGVLSVLERADREDEIADWLERHDSDPAHAEAIGETSVTVDALDTLAESLPPTALDAALRWVAADCTTRRLAVDVEQAATRIHKLVGAVKRFTYMDSRAGSEVVNVEPGLNDTIRVVASKAKAKGAAISLDVEPNLPPVRALGDDLNQVWMNLIDNALDAISKGGRIEVKAEPALDRVVVQVIDDGPGIPADVLPRIFDPFFTTKPPGEGTGLGLDITRRLLRQSHGDITVESKPGRTAFTVNLMVAETPARNG